MSLLIYILPAITDAILTAAFFMAQVSTAERNADPSTVANFIALWALVYMISSFSIGRFVTRRNAAGLLIASSLGTTGISVGFAMTTSIPAMYTLMVGLGLTMAMFFVPFQVFMKQVGETRQRDLTHSVGLYTFSWSIGFASGTLVAAIMWEYLGWQASHFVNAGAALFVAAMTWLLKHAATTPRRDAIAMPADATGAAPLAPEPPQADLRYAGMPDLAWMGWVFSGLGCIAVRMIYGLFPSSAAQFDLSRVSTGLTLFLLSGTQATVGLWLGRYRWWMYRPLPILGAGMIGVAGLVMFAVVDGPVGFAVAAVCFGGYCGTFFFYLVFHAIVHPERSSRYVSVNEATVGLTSLLGPFVGGLVADSSTLRTSYLLTAGMIFIAIAAQTLLHAAKTRSMRAP